MREWLLNDPGSIALLALAAGLATIAIAGLVLLLSSSKREDSYAALMDEEIGTFSDDLGAWKRNEISLDEFLDRRWSFRNLR